MERIRIWFKRVCDKLAIRAGRSRKDVRQSVTIRLYVGKTEGAFSSLRPVEFQGERLAQTQSSVGIRRIQKALYKAVDGELLVHVKALEKSAGFPTSYSLHLVEDVDLAEGGDHEELGRAYGTLSLAEVLGGDRDVHTWHDTGH